MRSRSGTIRFTQSNLPFAKRKMAKKRTCVHGRMKSKVNSSEMAIKEIMGPLKALKT